MSNRSEGASIVRHRLEGKALEKVQRVRALDDPAKVKFLIRLFYAGCLAMVLLDFLFVFGPHKHAAFEEGVFPYELWFGFYPLYGFVACVLLVVVAKQMRKILMRDDNYYGQTASYDPSGTETGAPEFSEEEFPGGHGHE